MNDRTRQDFRELVASFIEAAYAMADVLRRFAALVHAALIEWAESPQGQYWIAAVRRRLGRSTIDEEWAEVAVDWDKRY